MPAPPRRERPSFARPRVATADLKDAPTGKVNSKTLALLTGLIVLSLLPFGSHFAGSPAPAANGFAIPARAREPIAFFIHVEGLVIPSVGSAVTVGEALKAAGVRARDGDLVVPPAAAFVTPGLHIYVYHYERATLAVDGDTRTFLTRARTIAGVLASQQVVLGPLDRVWPPLDAALQDSVRVTITRVRHETVTDSEPAPYATVYRYDPTLAAGEHRIEEGTPGTLHRELLVIYEDEAEVSRAITREWVDPEPKERVIYSGPEPEDVPTDKVSEVNSSGPCASSLDVWATWYAPWTAGRPATSPTYGLSASGLPVRRGIVATDPSVIPLGTRLHIPGYGYAVAADTGGGLLGNHIDLGYADDESPDWRTGWVTVCILS